MQTEFLDDFSGVLRVTSYLCCFTQFTVDRSKLTVNGSVLSDTPNVRYLVALYHTREFASMAHVGIICVKTIPQYMCPNST